MEVGLSDAHSERVQTVRDLDGSITGISGATVIRPQEFYVTDDCEHRENWRMAVCPFLYTRVNILVAKKLYIIPKSQCLQLQNITQ